MLRLPGSIVILLLVLVLGACVRTPPPRPNVVLISLDTAAALHMGVYGYRRDTTPFLNSLAPDSVVFENARSQSQHTTSSHYSMFTGLYPQNHKVFARYDSDRYVRGAPLATTIKTLTEQLRAAGYSTHFIGETHDNELDLHSGLERGFDSLTQANLSGTSLSEATEAMKAKLATLTDKPFFVFIHSYVAHVPYCAGTEFAKLFDPSLTQVNELTCDAVKQRASNKHHSSPVHFYEFKEAFEEQFHLDQNSDRVHYEALYDGGIRQADALVKTVYDELKDRHQLDNTIFIVTSDHGEAFNEHGQYAHVSAFREILNVPLIMKVPDQKPLRVSTEVLDIDITPTILDFLKLKPASPVDGRSLLPLLAGRARAPQGFRYAMTYDEGAIWDDDWKLVVQPSGKTLLFESKLDPFERRDVSAEHLDITKQMKLSFEGARSSR